MRSREFVKSLGMDDGYEKRDRAVHKRTGFHLSEQSPLEHVKAVTVPTLVAQVHDDTMTRSQDVQDVYDAMHTGARILHESCKSGRTTTIVQKSALWQNSFHQHHVVCRPQRQVVVQLPTRRPGMEEGPVDAAGELS